MSSSQHDPGRSLAKRRKLSGLHFAGTAVLAGAMAVTALAGVSGATAKASVKSHTKTVKPDYSFFRGKSIHWITPGAPGSTQDQVFRAMLPSLQATLGATFVQQIVPGNQVIAADELAGSAPDGLTIGTQGVGSALYNQITGVTPENFSLQKVTYFGALNNTPYILVSCTGSGVTSLNQLVNSKTQITYLDFPNTGSIIMHTLLEAYGVNVKYLTGYTQPTLEAGCIRGDGTVAAGSDTNIVADPASLPPGETLLAISKLFVKGTSAIWMNTAPTSTTIAAFEKKHPIKNTAARRALNIALTDTVGGPLTAFYGPYGIAPAKAAAIAAAVKKAENTAPVKTVLFNVGIPPGWIEADAMVPFIKKEVAHFPLIRKFVVGNGV